MILVTGAGGAVGSALVQEMRAAGQQVRPAYHSRTATPQGHSADEDVVTVDFAEPATLDRALEDVDAVFLLSATGPEQSRLELNVLEAAKAAAVSRVVKLSVWRADEELTPIARLHHTVEQAIEASGLAFTFLRPNFYMQNFLRQMGSSIREGVIAQPESDAAISFVDIRDVASVAATVLGGSTHDGPIYDITGPEALSYERAADVLSRVLARPVRFEGLSDPEARSRMSERGLPKFYVETLIEVSRAYRDGGAERVTATVRDLTGREPIPFERFAADHRTAFM